VSEQFYLSISLRAYFFVQGTERSHAYETYA
jgi:hypothetical protein